jgi:hypothetical protein
MWKGIEVDDEKWQAGQTVTVHDHYQGPRRMVKIERITKRKVVLEDGSEWSVYGHVYGARDPYYTGQRIRPLQQGDAEAIFRRRATALIEKTEWGKLDLDRLNRIVSILKEGKYD